MYVQHPYKFDGKYFANIDSEFIEISKEVAMAMLSDYRKQLPSPQKKYMSVPEMGRLLGLKKTERYWLVHKNYFKTEVILGRMRVELESFEKWYANQVKYHKVTGEEPGLELKQNSYSARDIAKMLNLSEAFVYDLMNEAGVEYIVVDYWKRFPKAAFDEWYKKQIRYRTPENREMVQDLLDSTMRMPEMARLLGITRSTTYSLIKASDILETIMLDGRRRVTKESFYKWYASQNKYHIVGSEDDHIAVKDEENHSLEAHRREVLERDGHGRNIGTDEYLTINEAAVLADANPATVTKWIKAGKFEAIRHGKAIRIPRQSFEGLLRERR